MMAVKSIYRVERALVLLGVALFLGPLLAADGPGQQPSSAVDAKQNTETILRELAARSANWISSPANLEKLEYDFISGSDVTRVRVLRGEPRRNSVWMGTTLHAGFQSLVKFPDRYTITLTRQPDAKTITLLAKPKKESEFIAVEIGNGVENSWHGYYSHQARETTIVVDTERLVPLEEQTGVTHVRYSDWQNIGQGKWVPRRIDVIGPSAHYRMYFDWLGKAVWLLRKSESITPEATYTHTRTRNVLPTAARSPRHRAPTTSARRSHASARDHAGSQRALARQRSNGRRVAAAVPDLVVQLPHRARGHPRNRRSRPWRGSCLRGLPTTGKAR